MRFSIGLASLLVSLFNSSLHAQWVGPRVSDSLSVQGYLTDSGGTPIDGIVPVTFKLYKGSAQVWSQTVASVPVSEGLFSVYVGGNKLDTVAFNGQMDLGITVDTDPEIVPRTPLVASGFARAIPGFYAFYAEDFNWRTWNVVGGAPNNRIENPQVSVGNTIGGGGGRSTAGSTANAINGDFNTISGGHGNYISTFDATIGGGINNQILGYQSVIGGGYSNLIDQNFFASTISGGYNNDVLASTAVVGGGVDNMAGGTNSTVGGGDSNEATNTDATVAGGSSNTASGSGSSVGGGLANRATGIRATVPGGNRNQARGESSFAAGYYARAKHDGTFVWNDLSVADSTVSTAANQFLVRAAGGVGIGTDAPISGLHVVRNINAAGSIDNHVMLIENAATGTNGDGLAIMLGAANPGASNNFISFFDGDSVAYGRIDGNGSNGVVYGTTGGDYAEYLPRLHPSERIEAGDIVGVSNGSLTLETSPADRVMAITDRPAVLGNMPDPTNENLYERVAFVGQVPVLTSGSVESGDYLVPSGRNDGTAVGKRPEDLRPVDLDRIVGVAWESNPDPGLKKVIAEVGLDRARATRLAFENELAQLWTLVRAQQERLDMLEARGDL